MGGSEEAGGLLEGGLAEVEAGLPQTVLLLLPAGAAGCASLRFLPTSCHSLLRAGKISCT